MTEITDIVRVNSSFLTAGVSRREFGRTLFVYPQTAVSTAIATITLAQIEEQGRELSVQVFSNQDGVEAAYDSSDPAYEAGSIYFQQDPFPRNFLTAGWFESGADAYVWGGPIGSYTSLTTTNLIFAGNSLTMGDISSLTADEVAVLLQAQLRGINGIANAEVDVRTVGTDSVFLIKIPIADLAAAGSLAFSGTTAAVLGLDSEASSFAGASAETMAVGLSRIVGVDNSWYWLTLAQEIEENDTNALLASSWVSSRPYHLIMGSNDLTTVTPNEAASLFARLRAFVYDRVTGIWSRFQDYKAVALAGTFASVSFDGSGSLITAKFRTLTGTTPDVLTGTETAELKRKRINFYESVGGRPIVSSDGTTFGAGRKYIDSIQGIDWLNNAVLTDLFSALETTRRIPNTVDGVATIKEIIAGVCEDAVQNGLLAPIEVSATMAGEIRRVTGNQSFAGVLANGYLVHAGLINSLSQSLRDARQTVGYNVYAKLSGAVHEIETNLTYEN